MWYISLFSCAVASLANIGITAPVLAGAYSSALVPVGILMALLGYIIGTGGGLIVAQLMSLIAFPPIENTPARPFSPGAGRLRYSARERRGGCRPYGILSEFFKEF